MKPDAIFHLRVPRSHQIVVYIWPTLGGLWDAIRRLSPQEEFDDRTCGYFYGPALRMTIARPHNVVRRVVVGQIHLARHEFGAGTLAHELQHFMSRWTTIKGYDVTGRDWERTSYLAGNLTSQFWMKYKERFE